MKKLLFTLLFFTVVCNAQVGINTTNPKTVLDVNGAITNRQTDFTISSNAININKETSLANLKGTATSEISVTCYTPSINGHRLIISNTTNGNYAAKFAGITIPNGNAVEFIYAEGSWKTTNGNKNIYDGNGTLNSNRVVDQENRTLTFDGTGDFLIDSGDVGIGTTSPDQKLHVDGNIKIDTGSTIYYQDLPDYRLVLREEFESAVTGWTNNSTTTVFGQKILGGYGKTSNTKNSKQFDLSFISPTPKSIKIKFNYYAIDSWDDEDAYVYVDWGGAWHLKDLSHFDASRINHFAGSNNYYDAYYHGEIETPYYTNLLIIVVGSGLNESPTNESYGLDNLEIWVR